MKERPMIFNAEMVRAILDGRKTQTRRPVNPQPELTAGSGFSWNGHLHGAGSNERETNRNFSHVACPHGKPGDRIWVREAYRVHSKATDLATLVYRASVQNSWTEQTRRVPVDVCNKPVSPEKWTPSIHMPRWASRITLEITGVRVERLHAISEADARTEGVTAGVCPGHEQVMHRVAFRELWQSLYNAENWQANPWVWVVEFERVEGAA